jgi:hypothetical protein
MIILGLKRATGDLLVASGAARDHLHLAARFTLWVASHAGGLIYTEPLAHSIDEIGAVAEFAHQSHGGHPLVAGSGEPSREDAPHLDVDQMGCRSNGGVVEILPFAGHIRQLWCIFQPCFDPRALFKGAMHRAFVGNLQKLGALLRI